jgi:YD repeat-containing protein
MHQRCVSVVLCLLALSLSSIGAQAQTATYHLHKEASKTAGLFQLRTAAPDAAATTIASADLKNQPAGEYVVKAFDTPAGVPNATGTIPSGSIVSFTLWMKKSANAAALYPRAKLKLNSAAGASLCTITGNAALTTTLTAYGLSCATAAHVVMSAADRFYLWVGVSVTAAPGNAGVKAQLSIEGSLNGNYDSRVVAPLPIPTPVITSVTPTSGPVGAAISISGSNFGAAQGTSLITFNGYAATPSSWAMTAIAVAVPPVATTGPVVVSIRGLASNGLPFTVITDGALRGVVARVSDRAPVSGALVDVLRTGTVVAQSTTNASGQYGVGALAAGVYDLRASATGFTTMTRTGVTVLGGETRTEDFALVAFGGVTGQVVRSTTGAPIVGATITATSGATTASATSDAAGTYTIPTLPSGTYMVTATAEGYRPATSSAVVSDGAFIARNFALDHGVVSYAYDELDRLIAVVEPGGTSAAYRYDAVGNILSIARQSADTLALFAFAPTRGVAGTTVTITGTAFSPTAAGNMVRFNGVPAVVASASPTQIVATVPAGAVSGPLTVATADATAASAMAFTVLADEMLPAIAGFSPSLAMRGMSIAITGSNFDPSAGSTRVRQNLTDITPASVQPALIDTTLPATATSGHLSVRTPAGAAVSGDILFVAPPPYETRDVGFTATTAIGQTIAVPNRYGEIGLIAFDGAAGQRVAIRAPESGNSLRDPYGRDMAWFWSFLRVRTLPIDGTYTVVKYQCYFQCGSAADFTVFDVPPDVTALVAADDRPLTFDLTAMGQRARLVFAAAAGQHVRLAMSDGTPECCLYVSLFAPNGLEMSGSWTLGVDEPFDIVLSEAGTYSLVLDPAGIFDRGHFTVALHDVEDAFVLADVDGPAVTATTPEPDSDVYASFAGTTGARLAILFSDVTFPTYSWVQVRNPDGSILTEGWLGRGPEPFGHDFDLGTLPQTGTYTVFLDEPASRSGYSVTLQIVTRPPELP